MKVQEVQEHQTIIDMAIQCTGSADAAYDLAVLNGLSLSDDLVPGVDLILPEVVNQDIVSYYTTKAISPATAWLDNAERVVSAADVLISDNTLLTNDLITALEGQTLIDIAIQTCGSADAVFDLAVANGMSLSDDLIPGMKLIPVSAINTKIVSYYKQKGIQPATSVVIDTEEYGVFDVSFDLFFE